jgi:Amiloride-sensitive sodium channel
LEFIQEIETMRILLGIPGVKMCGISDIKCYQEVNLQNTELEQSQDEISDCHCLPPCTSITYDGQINQLYMTDEVIAHLTRNEPLVYFLQVSQKYDFQEI